MSDALGAPSLLRGVRPLDHEPAVIRRQGRQVVPNRFLLGLYSVRDMLLRGDSRATVAEVVELILVAPDTWAEGVLVVPEELWAGSRPGGPSAPVGMTEAAAADSYYEDLVCIFGRLGIAPPASPEEHSAAVARVKSALDETRGSEFSTSLIEQFIQIAQADEKGVDAGSLISKSDKVELADQGLVEPKYGTGFRLTKRGVAKWADLKRIVLSAAAKLHYQMVAEPGSPPPAPSSSSGTDIPADKEGVDAYAQCCLDYPGWTGWVRAELDNGMQLVRRGIIGRFTVQAVQDNTRLRYAAAIPLDVLKEFVMGEGYLLVPGEAVTFIEPMPKEAGDGPRGEGLGSLGDRGAVYVSDIGNLGAAADTRIPVVTTDAAEQCAGRDL